MNLTNNRLDIPFNIIDVSWLERYEKWLRSRGNKETTISLMFRTLRSTYNKAIKDKCAQKSNYPFEEYGTNTTKYSQNQLAKELGIATGTISNYMKQTIDNGYISKDENGIHLLREDIFYIAKMSKSNFRKKKIKSEKPIQMPIIILD